MGILRVLQNRNKVLGLNERQLGYIRPYNPKAGFVIADNKIITKKKLSKAGIPVPKAIGVISSHKELEAFDFDNLPKSFVIKPVRGLEGGGIEIVYNKINDQWIKSDGSRLRANDLRAKCRDIIDGRFSLLNQPDEVLIEERVKPHKSFRNYTYKGAPDIRIIVFNKVPVMAMLRLPTKQSDGKANLRQGAIGSGIDIAVGRVTQSIIGKSGTIDFVPGTKLRLSGLRIPHWNAILEHAVNAAQIAKLGFASIDFLIDREDGPLVVELNARTGLSIQLAEQDGLLWRLEKVKGLKVRSSKHGITLGKELFGGEIEDVIENISGKQIIGLIEKVVLYSRDGEKTKPIIAKIDTGADSTSVDADTLAGLGYNDFIEMFSKIKPPKTTEIAILRKFTDDTYQEIITANPDLKELLYSVDLVKSSSGVTIRAKVKIRFEIDGQLLDTVANFTNRDNLQYKMIIGRRDLRRFLIDPSKAKLNS